MRHLSLTGTDRAGSGGEARILVDVDNTPPVVAISTPADGALLTGPVEIAGTAADAHFDSGRLEFSPGTRWNYPG